MSRGNLGQFDEAVTCLEKAIEAGPTAVNTQQAQEMLLRARAGAAEKKAAAEAASLRQGAGAEPSGGGEAKPSGGGGEAKPQEPLSPPAAAASSSRGCTVCGQQRDDPPLTGCGGCKRAGVSKRRRPRNCSKECQVEHWKNGGHRDECLGNKK